LIRRRPADPPPGWWLSLCAVLTCVVVSPLLKPFCGVLST